MEIGIEIATRKRRAHLAQEDEEEDDGEEAADDTRVAELPEALAHVDRGVAVAPGSRAPRPPAGASIAASSALIASATASRLAVEVL